MDLGEKEVIKKSERKNVGYVVKVGEHYVSRFENHRSIGVSFTLVDNIFKAHVHMVETEDMEPDETESVLEKVRGIAEATGGRLIEITETTKSEVFIRYVTTTVDES
jgi:SepF-like predicted cell division protein (DUF552 family)